MSLSEQGLNTARYSVVPRTLIFLTSRERVLLIKGASGKRLWANLYNGLGGHIERGEDVFSAAQRELYEETGLGPIELWLCGIITIDTGQDKGVIIFVLCGETNQTQVVSSAEGVLEWLEVDQLGKYPLVEDLPLLLPRVLACQPGGMPFSAHYQARPDCPLDIQFYR